MRLKNSVVSAVVAVGLAVTGFAGASAAQAVTKTSRTAPAAPSAPSASNEQLTLQQLLDLTRTEVHDLFPNATLMLADGSSPTGPTRDMTQVTDWHLVYNTNDAASRIKSIELFAYLDGQINEPIYRTQPWGGVLPIRHEIGLSPEEAYAILVRAGHGNAYKYVSLVKPLVFRPELQYHFSNIRGGCDGFAVNVDGHAVNPICG
jgi:hypothetical protein